MDFDLSDEHRALRDTVREFAESVIAPVAEELDRESRFPVDIVRQLGEMGLMGVPFDAELGGGGADTLAYAITIEELTRIDSSVGVTVAAHTSLGTSPIAMFGNEEQKARYLPDLCSGRRLAAFGLTEPGGGSDAGATRTRAVEQADGSWVVDGEKMFITNAGTELSGVVSITALTGDGEISNLIVENGTPGYEISAPLHKMGWHASDTRALSFQGCQVGPEALLGERGAGLKQFLQILDGGRISIAAMGLGLAQGAFEQSLQYAKAAQRVRPADREVPGDPVQARRHGDRDRRGAAPRLPRCLAEGSGAAVRARRLAGEALHGRAVAPGRQRGRADPRRLRLHGRVPDQPLLPRPEDPRDRRGHERGAAPRDRARSRHLAVP